MMTYEKPNAEFVNFESDNVMTNIGPGLPDLSGGIEDLE